MHKYIPAICILSLFCACNNNSKKEAKAPVQTEQTISRPDNFAEDLKFLREFASPAVLKDSTSKSAIAIVNAWQGRVVTSTVADDGRSFGWLNYATIENGKQYHFSTYGGEDRLLFGPTADSPCCPRARFYRHHITCATTRSIAGHIRASAYFLRQRRYRLEGNLHIPNNKGNIISADVSRTVTLLSRRDLHNYLGADIHRSIHAVGFHSDNIITNANSQRWDTAYGATSIRIRGTFPVSQKTIAIIPCAPEAPSLPRVLCPKKYSPSKITSRISGQTATPISSLACRRLQRSTS